VFLKLEIIKKSYGLAVLALAIWLFRSPIGIAMSAAVTAPLGSFVNAYPNKKLLNYGFGEQMKDFLPSFVLSVVMGVGVYMLSDLVNVAPILQLSLLTIIGLCFYLGVAKLLRFECLEYLVKSIKDFRAKKG
jgi:hypothetical protein